MTDKFCILPWKHLTVGTEGTYKLCCMARRAMTDGDAPMSVYHHSLEHAWNSEYMRDIRRAMLAGEMIPDCQSCYEHEAHSGSSYRTDVAMTMMDRPIEQVRAETEANDYRVDVEPRFLKLEMGNLCNLQCRMCGSLTSSQIERDPVHSRWAPIWSFDNFPVAAWKGDVATIGPHSLVGVYRTGFSAIGTVDGRRYCWSGKSSSVELDLDEETVLQRLEIKFNELGQRGQMLTIAVNGKVVVEQPATPENAQVAVDLTREVCRPLRIEIQSLDVDSGQGVAVEEIRLLRQPAKAAELPNQILFSRLPERTLWENEDAFIFGEALRNAANLDRLYITGGEPFLMKKVIQIIDHLIDTGNTHVTLEFSTNCTKITPDIVRKLSMFKAVRLDLSLDGVKGVHEYIRFPMKWHVLDRNVRLLKPLPNAIICVTPVVQIYNAMDLVDLCRYADELGVGFSLSNVLHGPEQLAVSLMPSSALRLAAERLRKYAEEDCRPWNRSQVLSTAQYFESLPGTPSPLLFRKFMLFTNDLDVTRQQKFADVHSELYHAFREVGYHWTEETRYARTKPAVHQRDLTRV